MDGAVWLTLLGFGLILILAFGILFYIANMRLRKDETTREWLEEMDKFGQKHPVWNFCYIFLPFPLGLLLQLIGPKPPKYPSSNE
jgi:hypothetical protein